MDKPQSDLNTEPTPKIFLQNKLTLCRSKLQELVPPVAAKRKSSSAVPSLEAAKQIAGKELNQLTGQLSSYKVDHTVGSIDELSDVRDHHDGTGRMSANYRCHFAEIFGNTTPDCILYHGGGDAECRSQDDSGCYWG